VFRAQVVLESFAKRRWNMEKGGRSKKGNAATLELSGKQKEEVHNLVLIWDSEGTR